jgi:DNA-binding MarR family transcriptional regulator
MDRSWSSDRRRRGVARKPNPNDRRSQLINLTASGRKIATRLAKALAILEHKVFASVDTAAVAGVTALVDAIAEAVTPDEPARNAFASRDS